MGRFFQAQVHPNPAGLANRAGLGSGLLQIRGLPALGRRAQGVQGSGIGQGWPFKDLWVLRPEVRRLEGTTIADELLMIQTPCYSRFELCKCMVRP